MPIAVGHVHEESRIVWERGETERRYAVTVGLDEQVLRMTEQLAQPDALWLETDDTRRVLVQSIDGRDVTPRDGVSEDDYFAEVDGLRDRCDDPTGCEVTVVFALIRDDQSPRSDRIRVDYRLTRTEIRGLPGSVPHDGVVTMTVERLASD